MPLSAQKDYQLLFFETAPPRIKPKFERSPTNASIFQSPYQQQPQQQQQRRNMSPTTTTSMRNLVPGSQSAAYSANSAINEQHMPLKISPPSAIRTAAEFITHHRGSTSSALASSNLMFKSATTTQPPPPIGLMRQTTGGGGEYASKFRTSSLFHQRGNRAGANSLTSLELKPATVEGNDDNDFDECHHPA